MPAIDGQERIAAGLGREVRFAAGVGGPGFRVGDRFGGNLSLWRSRRQTPLSALVNQDRDRLVSRRVEVLEHCRGGGERHFVFAGAAAVDHADAKFFHKRKLTGTRLKSSISF